MREVSTVENRLKGADGAIMDGEAVSKFWIVEPTRFLEGADYVNCFKARINALLTSARYARGRLKMKECRGGCRDTETMNHILQFCHRTHSSRLKRHNAITSYIIKKCEKRRWQVFEEEKIKVGDNIVKPDPIIAKGNRIIGIDAQVVGDQQELDRAHQDKKRKY